MLNLSRIGVFCEGVSESMVWCSDEDLQSKLDRGRGEWIVILQEVNKYKTESNV